MEAYSEAFESVRAARRLEWIPQLGNVCLELNLSGSTMEFTVSPRHATVIMLFDESGTLRKGICIRNCRSMEYRRVGWRD